MSSGWDESARAWIATIGERGDWGREHVLDAVMLARVAGKAFARRSMWAAVRVASAACCARTASRRSASIRLLRCSRKRGGATRRPIIGPARPSNARFEDGRFDLVVSYLTLIDITDFRAAIGEMVRVLKPGGSLLIANMTNFASCNPKGWVRDESGRPLYYPVDRYLDEFPVWLAWKGIEIENWHRPLGAYMTEFLRHGLMLRFFQEPEPTSGDPERDQLYRRAPWFVVMEWSKESLTSGRAGA